MTPTPHGQVPEALIDLIDAYAETRHRCCGIYNAKTEAARKAVIEALSGVQALSAAPAGWKLVPEDATEEMVRATDKVNFANADTDGTMHNVWNVMIAASPTPPVEQAAPKAAPVTQQAGYAEVIECGNSYAKVKLKGEAFGSARVGDIFYTALQQDEPVGEVVSASCDHATVRWLHQTSSVGGGDHRNSRAWPKVSGVSRDEGHSRALLVFFAAEPTDDEVRAVHDTLAAAPTAQAAPQPAPATQQVGEVVAYLDIGAGGYLDLGSALSDEALQQLPKGRHALVIAGTYGIDGYVAAPALARSAGGCGALALVC